MSRAARAARRVEQFGPKSEKEVLHEILQAKSEESALKVLREYGFAKWQEGDNDARADREEAGGTA